MDLGFRGKTVIITGATKGIGAGITEVFAQEGANLVINYRSDNEGSSTKFIEDIKAKYENGVLTLDMPKKTETIEGKRRLAIE